MKQSNSARKDKKVPLTPQEEKIVSEGERQHLQGKGTNWRKVKRG